MVPSVPEIFGSMVFTEHAMKKRLPKGVFKNLQRVIQEGKELDIPTAESVANAMKKWAIEKGATHFSHWFQPMTGITAEKHDSFITPSAGGTVIMEFSAKELIKGESDASSLPSGGLRATFEARGYTAWDPTSSVFVRGNTLFIPTAFCSYGGETLDMKTPLLRSMSALDKQAKRILKLFGIHAQRVLPAVGAEQEYFLIKEDDYKKRRDILLTGRTLFGAKPPKGQELEDHYFGTIRESVQCFMNDLNWELWKLGILAKTQHNESAPAQHELAPVFTTANLSADQNQLTMDIMKKIAKRHGLVCLLHEKPFAHINGSGKHNNWSLMTDGGKNLLEPGSEPGENTLFLLLLTAVLKAVNDYQDLLRISTANAANDHRLGAYEAPPAILSVYLGSELTAVLEAIENGTTVSRSKETKLLGRGTSLPEFARDTSDRNRTSPFAFTGNKFEFRMLGSSQSIACPNYILNTIVAESLRQFADVLEPSECFEKDMKELMQKTIKETKQIIFNGNNYSKEWETEAAKRKLLNLKNTPTALARFTDRKNIAVMERHGILTEKELCSRHDILLENYWKTIRIEAYTMLGLAKKQIIPAVYSYYIPLKDGLKENFSPEDTALLKKLSLNKNGLQKKIDELEKKTSYAETLSLEKRAEFYAETILPLMAEVRSYADALEGEIPEKDWPLPAYETILFYV